MANRGQSIAPPDETALEEARRRQLDDADHAVAARVPNSDQWYPTESSAANQPVEMTDMHSPADRYGSNYQYQAARPEPGYRQAGPTEQAGAHSATWDHGRSTSPAGYREPTASYQPYRNDSAATQWQDPAYRHGDGGTVGRQDYVAGPAVGNWPPNNAPPAADYRNAPHAADYRSQQPADYRSQQAADYRSQQPTDYRPYPAADYRQSPQAADYRSVPTTDNWANPAAGAPAQPYYPNPNPQLPTPNPQPTPGYHDGTGTQTMPGQGMPYYQADRRSETTAGYAPYGAQPGGAQFQGTIEQPPVPAQYESSGSRPY